MDHLLKFIQPREYYSVSFTSRLDRSAPGKNTVFIEKTGDEIISAVMLSPDGIICPVFTEESTLEPLGSIISGSAYAKKRYITLMGLKSDITAIENIFENKNRLSVDYSLFTGESSVIPEYIDKYLNKKDREFLMQFKTRKALPSDINKLMPNRIAYELEEVVLNPSHFNETACRNRYLKTISDETVIYAEAGGKPAASCCISSSGINWGQIGGVYTKPEYRSKGLSAMLMAEIAGQSSMQKKDLMLFVKKDNKAALTLYKNCGFDKKGEYRITYLESR